jgi:phage terminase large subunit
MTMSEIEFHTKVMNKVYLKRLHDMTPFQIIFGGSSSGKSVFAVGERTVLDLLQGGRNYLICRQVAQTIKHSVYNEVTKTIKRWGVSNKFKINKSEFTITCTNGYQILFGGLDDVEKIKSITPELGEITDIVVEEATETERESIKQLEKRLRGGDEKITKRITLLFNPILQTHWIYQDYFASIKWADDQTEYQDENISILKTTYKDNKFLTKQDISRLENEKDKYYYDVYTLGKWGILGDVIFKNWKCLDLSKEGDYYLPVEQRTNRRNGLDFGFSSDPAAIPVMHYDKMRKRLFIYDEFYERGLTNQELSVEITNLIGKDLITCDSSEPKSIQELQIAGVNARGAKKGKDSVNFGVQWLQGLEIIIDVKCVNAKREFSTYHWKKNKDGDSLRIPVDKDNHLIDAARYALEDDMIIQEVQVVDNPFF